MLIEEEFCAVARPSTLLPFRSARITFLSVQPPRKLQTLDDLIAQAEHYATVTATASSKSIPPRRRIISTSSSPTRRSRATLTPTASIRKEAEGKAQEQHRLKDLEKEKVINDLKSALEDMKRKADQGSMETQGEVLEQDFEAQLKRFFLHDDIAPVPKGIRGADLIQTVRTPLGADCGVLLWETKNTKAWGGDWIAKLKDDMIATRATMAILVSVVLPEGVTRFGLVNGVWVSDPFSAIPLAAALRDQLVALDRERQSSVGKNEKMELLYHYLAGTEFKQKIEGIVEAFTAMQDQVNKERRAMEKHWAEREKQIGRVIKNTVGLYGDMQGIIGGAIPQIPALELGAGASKALPAGSNDESAEEEV